MRARAQKFETMLDDPEMRLLGLRGLYLEAERLGDRNAARHYAGRAAAVAPQLAWAAESTLEELTGRGDWDGALKLVEAQKSTRQIERDAANRRRAVLLTAKAQALIDSDPNAARTAAHRSQPAAARFRAGRGRRGQPHCSGRTMCARARRSSRRRGRPSRIRRSPNSTPMQGRAMPCSIA